MKTLGLMVGFRSASKAQTRPVLLKLSAVCIMRRLPHRISVSAWRQIWPALRWSRRSDPVS